MAEEKIDIPKNILQPLSENLEEAVEHLKDEKTVPLGIRDLGAVRDLLKSIPDFIDTPENRYGTYVVWDLLGNTLEVFKAAGKDKEWREENKENIEEIKTDLIDYLSKINVYFSKGAYGDILMATKMNFYTLNTVAKKLTVYTK